MITPDAEYQAALDYLYSYVDFSLQKNFRYSPDQFDLGRMRDLAHSLGDPFQAYQIIHVAGTKGKGSVSALCASALHAAGYRVGLYTSPHLDDYAERIQVNGNPISHPAFVDLVERIKPHVAQIPRLTTFEISTALAMLYFQEQNVDVGVLEVGLGGRLDATNIVTPCVSVITSISYDHTQILGETLAEIAAEKAGIIKDGVPVVVSPLKEEAYRVVALVAEEHHAPMICVGQDYLFAPIAHSLEGQSLYIWPREEQAQADAFIKTGGDLEWKPTHLSIPLLGYHQVENAATAYAALQTIRMVGLPLNETAIQTGFCQAHWPGRFEILRRHPPLVVDSAHNRDSALKLRLALDDYFKGYPVILVFGASEDKDVQGMFAELLPRATQMIAVKSYHPRAMEAESLVDLAHQFGCPARAVPEVVDGVNEAIRLAGKDSVVLVTGSIFVAAGARIAWEKGSLIEAVYSPV